jgi:porphyrinogen peroxidase
VTVTDAQNGIFAVGTSAHVYLELNVRSSAGARDLVRAMTGVPGLTATTSGVSLVTGYRPEMWRSLEPEGLPRDVSGFNQEIRGAEGFTMPTSQHDAVAWLAGSSPDALFDAARRFLQAVDSVASVAEETSAWAYHHDRDLTGFIDGSENPSLLDAPSVALIPEGRPGAGGTVLLLQKWTHDAAKWEALDVPSQERVIGRTKLDSTELDPRPPYSHVTRTDQDSFGNIFRRNMPFGSVTNHGTMFVGFSAEQSRLARMLESMVGLPDGHPDELMRYTTPVTGAYYFVPSVDALRRVSAAP